MEFVYIVRDNFLGLETIALLDEYKQTIVKNINRKTAICAKLKTTVIGILLFSKTQNMLSCMAVHPCYRKQKVATNMIKLMFENLDKSRDITVITFRTDDKKGLAPRALYKKLGFEETEDCYHLNYPTQKFILRAK